MTTPQIVISYNQQHAEGVFRRGPGVPDGVWIRLREQANLVDSGVTYTTETVCMGWPSALSVLRIISNLQGKHGFVLTADDSSSQRISQFMKEYQVVRRGAAVTAHFQSDSAIDDVLALSNWDFGKRRLKPYQFTNLMRLTALPHGANFSVPGAGKTTVTWALHLLMKSQLECLLVVAPRSAFPAWNAVIGECMREDAPHSMLEPFTALVGGEAQISTLLTNKAHRFIISYDQLIRVEKLIEGLLSTRLTHLVLDESHRMKEGYQSKRGATLLGIGHLAKRRDILSGTPMPQSPQDMLSQLNFLWPGVGLGTRIARGEAPRAVLGTLYVRTTKSDLELPERESNFIDVDMLPAQLALYSVLRDHLRARASVMKIGTTGFDLAKARRSVMRLLQAATVPEALAGAFHDDELPALVKAAIQEGPSARILKAIEMAREFARSGRKVLIWTIFTPAIEKLRHLLADLNPAVIYGATASGSENDERTREGNLKKFKEDSSCWVMIANPAAASEGISLHMHCHDAIYVDRSYNATHFLQSIDRIHRLGLPMDVRTQIFILRNNYPVGLGSIDFSVGRRLAVKIRNLQELLDDPDLHELALDEESAGAPIDDSISIEDIDDLVAEIENRASHQPELLT